MSIMSKQEQEGFAQALNEVQKEEAPSEPTILECGEIFDAELLDQPDPDIIKEMTDFINNPMGPLMKMLGQYFESLKPRMFEPVSLEHKVRIFWLHRSLSRDEVDGIEVEIEALSNDGYCCHMPTTCGDFLIMDFSRRKDGEDETATRATNQ